VLFIVIEYTTTAVILCTVSMLRVSHARLSALRLRVGIVGVACDRVTGMHHHP